MRIGLAGAGWVSAHHLDAWATLRERASVVAIADPNLQAARARAAHYGIAHAFPSVSDMFNAGVVAAIDVATPVETHVRICEQAADRGIAILCQKPLAPTVAQAQALIDRINRRVPFMVHENWRFRPHYRQIREWLRAGHIGQVRSAVMTVFSSGLLPDANGQLPALVRQPNLALLERMLVMEILIHHIDVLRFLIGELTLEAAEIGKSCAAIRGEDRATLFLTGPHQQAITLAGDFTAPGHPPLPFDHLTLIGTRGSILLHENQLHLKGDIEETLLLDLAANYRASYRDALAHFLDGGPFETSPEDHLQTLKLVEAAYGGPLCAG